MEPLQPESLPNLLALTASLPPFYTTLKSGLWNASSVLLNTFLLSHLFGWEMGMKGKLCMLLFLQGPLGPISPDVPGVRDFVFTLSRWWCYDGPVDGMGAVDWRALGEWVVYQVPALWVTLDPWGLWRVYQISLGDTLTDCLMMWVVAPEWTVYVALRVSEWVLSELLLCKLFYALLSIFLSLRGYIWAVKLFLIACLFSEAVWPALSEKERIVFRLLLIAPPLFVYTLVQLPIAPIWLFRHTLKIPYFWMKFYSRNLWYRFFYKLTIYRGEETYKHNPLESGEIRLLSVSRNSNWELQIHIQQVKLEEAPEYDAISYTWGDSTFRHGILVDGAWLPLTQNAFEILQDRVSQKPIWMDCICINQKDDVEKSSQVAMMGEIYKKATRVIIWLGNSRDGPQAFSLLSDLWERAKPTLMPDDAPAALKSAMEKNENARPGRFASFERFDPRFKALARLLMHDYFFRAWIRQEVIFGNLVHVRCGGAWIDWKIFSGTIKLFVDSEKKTLIGQAELHRHLREPQGCGDIINLSIMKEMRERQEETGLGKPRLGDLLMHTWMMKATDPRDMVYALLGLSLEANLPEFAPDYSISPVEVYTRLSAIFWERNELAGTIYMAGIGYPRKLEGLTSWIPDWSSTPLVGPLRRTGNSSENPYNASGGKDPSITIINENTLSVKGIWLDKIIATVSSPFAGIKEIRSQDDRIESSFDEIFKNIEVQALISTLPSTYLNGQPREEALWRTLLGDTTSHINTSTPSLSPKDLTITQRPANPSYRHLFATWKKLAESVQAAGIRKGMTATEIKRRILLAQQDPAFVNNRYTEAWKSIQRDQRWIDAFATCASGRRFAVTERGYMALVPPLAEKGDGVVVVYGLDVPFVVRGWEGMEEWELVGECYVHGVMDGEVLGDGGLEEVEFVIR